jgi:hypothetical protein
MKYQLVFFVGLIVVAAIATDTTLLESAEDKDLHFRLSHVMQEQAILEEALKSKVGGWKRPDEFNMKELNTMLQQSEQLSKDMRQIFTHIKMRETEQGLANFRALLTESFKDQGFEKDLPKIEKICKEHYLVLPEAIQFISDNWHSKEAKDKDTEKIHGFEREYHLLLYDHDWLLRNSYRPIPDLENTLKTLHANRDSLRSWLASPVVGDPRSNLLQTEETETEAEADTEAESESFVETSAAIDRLAEEEQELDEQPQVDPEHKGSDFVDFSFAEAEANSASSSEDSLLDENIDGRVKTEAEMEADNEFGIEDTDESIAKEAEELDKMAQEFHKEGLL